MAFGVMAFILLLFVFALLIFPAYIGGRWVANSRPGALYKVAGYAIICLGFVPVLFWAYALIWVSFIST